MIERAKLRLAIATIVLATALGVALVVIAFGGRGGGGGANRLAAFNACLAQKRFLTVTKHRFGDQRVEMINDRSQGALVGEFAELPSLRDAETFTSTIGPPNGSGARNGRRILFTSAPSGRDANAIETCGSVEFPVT